MGGMNERAECDGCKAACESQIRDLVERLREAQVRIMELDEVLRLVQEAAREANEHCRDTHCDAEQAAADAAWSVEAEREACAQVAYHFGAHSVADAIRARGSRFRPNDEPTISAGAR